MFTNSQILILKQLFKCLLFKLRTCPITLQQCTGLQPALIIKVSISGWRVNSSGHTKRACMGIFHGTERNGNGTHVPEVNVPSYISKAIASRHS